MNIEKKIWPKYFQAILDGKKNYELRLADWECNEGDTLLLKEWDPETKSYTGRELSKKVKYVAKFKIDSLFWSQEEIEKHGLQIISLE
jgi:predicted transcriptional regulator